LCVEIDILQLEDQYYAEHRSESKYVSSAEHVK